MTVEELRVRGERMSEELGRPWLTRYTALRGEHLAALLRDQHFALLAIVRRYAAKPRYELELFRAPSLEAALA